MTTSSADGGPAFPLNRYDVLLPEHRARFDEWVSRWIDIGLSCAPADRAAAESAYRECYRLSGLAEPKRIVWVRSPIVLAFAGPIATWILRQRGGAVGNVVRDAVSGSVTSAVDDAVRVAVHVAVRDAVDDAVHDAVSVAVGVAVGAAVDVAVGGAVNGAMDNAVSRAVIDAVNDAVDEAVRITVGNAVGRAVDIAVGDAVNNAVRDAVNDAVDNAVRDDVGGAVRDTWYKYLGGRLWSWWLSFESFFDEVCHVNHAKLKEARAYRRAQSAASWWWPHHDFVIACEPQTSLSRDERGQMHREDGPAIEWGDEWRLWFWHGVRVTEQIVKSPDTLTVDQIRAESNAEVQRIMIERLGPGIYLKRCGAKVIDVDTLTLIGSATRALMVDDLGNKWLVGTDGSTARVYHMSVPREVGTCREAHNAIAGFDETRLVAEA